MARRILFVALATLSFLFGSQNSFAQEFRLGANLGASLTQVDGDNLSGYNKMGPHLGIFVERELKANFGFHFDFLFTIKGAKNYVDINNITDPLKSAFYYAEVPLLLTYQVQKFKIEAGPSFGVLVWAYNKNNLGRQNTTDLYNRLEWAFHTGVSYTYNPSLAFYARYSYSLDCVDGGNCGKLFSNPKLRPGYFHNVISVGARLYPSK